MERQVDICMNEFCSGAKPAWYTTRALEALSLISDIPAQATTKVAFIRFALRLIRSFAKGGAVERKQVRAKVQRRIASLESFRRLLPNLNETIRPLQDLLSQDRNGISACMTVVRTTYSGGRPGSSTAGRIVGFF